MFLKILQEAADQVFNGKGKERHGHNAPFENQPWRHIVDNVGIGFLLGQALKKLMELRTFIPRENTPAAKEQAHSSWRREALGAIVYLVMAIMYKDNESKL